MGTGGGRPSLRDKAGRGPRDLGLKAGPLFAGRVAGTCSGLGWASLHFILASYLLDQDLKCVIQGQAVVSGGGRQAGVFAEEELGVKETGRAALLDKQRPWSSLHGPGEPSLPAARGLVMRQTPPETLTVPNILSRAWHMGPEGSGLEVHLRGAWW